MSLKTQTAPRQIATTIPSKALRGVRLSRTFARDTFFTTVSLLLAFGTVMVFSASAFYGTTEGDAYFFLRKQLSWLPLAILGGLACYWLDYRILKRRYWMLLALSAVLLALVLVPQIGRKVNESRRWLPVGGGFQFQPSELAKIAVVVFVAGFLTARPERRQQFRQGFLVIMGAIFPVFALILVEPDFGSAMFVFGLAFFLLFLGRVRQLFLWGSALLLSPVVAVFVHLRWEQIQSRLLGFLDPQKVHQVKHSLTALGSGGLWGTGLGASGQKLQFLPEPHTDFILAILGEELGYVGTCTVLLLFVALLWSGVSMLSRVKDPFGFLVGSGVVIALVFQAVLNVAVVTASMPTKGIPLPFFSFGGSGLCMTLAQVGLLFSIDRIARQGAGDGEAAHAIAVEAEGQGGAERGRV